MCNGSPILVLLNDTSSVVVLNSAGSVIAEMTEPIQIVMSLHFVHGLSFNWMSPLGASCTIWRALKRDSSETSNPFRVVMLVVCPVDGWSDYWFDGELRAIKSVPLNCQAFQICNNSTIYGYDSSSSRIVVSDVDSLVTKSVSFVMDCGVSRIVASKKHFATCMMEDGSVCVCECLLNRIMRRVIASGECDIQGDTDRCKCS